MAEKSGTEPGLALARLRELMIDPARFSTDAEVLSGYLEKGHKGDQLIAAVYPRGQADVEQVLEVARAYGLAVYTPLPWGLSPPRPGVVLDWQYMSDINDIDTRNLFLDVEPGVTWEQLLPELAVKGVRVALPAAAKSPYVLESALEREVSLSASRFTNKQLSTFHAVLADGREYRSGADALPSSQSHWREDGGPNISRIFSGSRNSFGLPIRGFVFLYPAPEARKVIVRGFANREQACRLAQRASRAEIGTEIVCFNKLKGKQALGGDPGLASWSVAFGLDGPERLVRYHQKRVDDLAAELKLKPKPGAAKVDKAMAEALDRAWYAAPLNVGFYTNFDKVEKLSALCETSLKSAGKLAQLVIPVKRGASVYVQYEVLDPVASAEATIKRFLPKLADAGAFFSNPTGALATHIFKKQPAYFDFLKDVKRFMDPDDVLNSGQVVEV